MNPPPSFETLLYRWSGRAFVIGFVSGFAAGLIVGVFVWPD